MTITKVAREFGLSRTALLYYERLGLLSPDGRSRSGYRVYSKRGMERLREICRLRETGLSLAAVAQALDGSRRLPDLLHTRLRELDEEIAACRAQQRFIARLLKVEVPGVDVGPMSKGRWSALLRAAGFSEDDMDDWHADFERTAPREHQAFLEFLMIEDEEIAKIREASGKRAAKRTSGTATRRLRGA